MAGGQIAEPWGVVGHAKAQNAAGLLQHGRRMMGGNCMAKSVHSSNLVQYFLVPNQIGLTDLS